MATTHVHRTGYRNMIELTTKEVFVIKWLEQGRYYKEGCTVSRFINWSPSINHSSQFDSYPEAQKILVEEIRRAGTFSIEKLFIKTHKYVD